MIVIGIILLVLGFVLAFLPEYEVLDIPYLLEELLPYVAVVCALSGIFIIFINLAPPLDSSMPEDIKSMEYSTNEQSKQSSCSLLGHSCIVEEWSPICLIQECIIDTRK